MPKPTFLYIEDDLLSQKVMEFILQDELGIDLIVFSDTNDLNARLDALTARLELAFVDIQIEPLDGFEVLPLLRAHERTQAARIIAVTASVMDEEVLLLRRAGFDGCLAKPLNYATFPAVVARMLAGESVWQIL